MTGIGDCATAGGTNTSAAMKADAITGFSTWSGGVIRVYTSTQESSLQLKELYEAGPMRTK